jgi:hypothetical protein
VQKPNGLANVKDQDWSKFFSAIRTGSARAKGSYWTNDNMLPPLPPQDQKEIIPTHEMILCSFKYGFRRGSLSNSTPPFRVSREDGK